MWRNVLDFNRATVHWHYCFTGTDLSHLFLLKELKVRKWGGGIDWNHKGSTKEGAEMSMCCCPSSFMFVGRFFPHQTKLLQILEILMFIQAQFSYQEMSFKENQPFLSGLGLFSSQQLLWHFSLPSAFQLLNLNKHEIFALLEPMATFPLIWIIP